MVKPSEEVLLLLDFFEDYDYLINGIKIWIEGAKVQNGGKIIYDEFEKELDKLDFEIVNDYSFEEFACMLEPMISFFNPGEVVISDIEFPLEALIIFLNDKHINTIASELEELFFNEAQYLFSKPKLIDVLNNYIKQKRMKNKIQASDEIKYSEMNLDDSFGEKKDYELLISDAQNSQEIISENLLNTKMNDNG